MHRRAVKGCPPQMLSQDIMDQLVPGQPCQLFAENFLQPSKDRVFMQFTRNQLNPQFLAYHSEKDNRGILNTFMYGHQHILMIDIVSDIIVKHIRAQLTYFLVFMPIFLTISELTKIKMSVMLTEILVASLYCSNNFVMMLSYNANGDI